MSAWLHFERVWIREDEIAVTNLIRIGCSFLFITGVESEDIEDNIDWIVSGITKDVVLTTSRSCINADSAFEFTSTGSASGEIKTAIVCVFANDDLSEHRLSKEIEKQVSTSLNL